MSLEKYYKLFEEYKSGKTEPFEHFLKDLSENSNSKEFFKQDKRREELQDKIIDKKLFEINKSDKPVLHFIIGHIGAGKTSLQEIVTKNNPKKYLKINFDAIKQDLPEYEILKRANVKKASVFLQSEVATIGPKLFRQALRDKKNIIFEKNVNPATGNETGKKPQIVYDIRDALKGGYRILIHIIFLPDAGIAYHRVEERFKVGKRYVSREDVQDSYDKMFLNLNEVLLNAIEEVKKCRRKKNVIDIEFIYNGNQTQEKLLFLNYNSLMMEPMSKYKKQGDQFEELLFTVTSYELIKLFVSSIPIKFRGSKSIIQKILSFLVLPILKVVLRWLYNKKVHPLIVKNRKPNPDDQIKYAIILKNRGLYGYFIKGRFDKLPSGLQERLKNICFFDEI